MATSVILPSFSGGELSTNLYARVDLDKYHSGVALLRNFFVDYRGGVANRPGTEFIIASASNDQVRLLPFIVSRDQSYIVELTALQARIFLRGVLVSTLTTVYGASEIWDVRYEQSADVMTLTHPSHPPYNINRTSALTNTFTITQVSFGASLPAPGQPTLTTTVAGTAISYVYCVTAVDKNGQESLASSPAQIGSKALDPTADTPVTISLSWTAVSGAVAYNIYKAGPVPAFQAIPTVYGYIGQAQVPAFTDNNIGPDFSITTPQHRDPFSPGQITSIDVTAAGTGGDTYTTVTISGDGSGAVAYLVTKSVSGGSSGIGVGTVVINGGINYTTATATPVHGSATLHVNLDTNNYYPACVSYYQQRRVYGGPDAAPLRLDFSKTGLYDNFDVTPSVLDSDAITVSLVSRQVNRVQHLVPMSTGLIVFTTGNAFLVTGGGQSSALTPSNIAATPQASTGAGPLKPIVVNYNILFQQYEGTVVRDMTFQWTTNSYFGTDRSMLANHLFNGHSLVDWAFAAEPYHLLHVVRDDGKMLVMAYVPEQEVYGWSQYDTQGQFLSVAAIPEDGETAVYTVVKRHIPGASPCWVNYLERFATRIDDCCMGGWYLDCATEWPRVNGSFTAYASGVSGNITIYSYDPCGTPGSNYFTADKYKVDFGSSNVHFADSNAVNKTGIVGNAVDQYNNLWTCLGGNGTGGMTLRSYSEAGVLLHTYTQQSLITAACTFALANQAPATSWTMTTNSGDYDTGFQASVFTENGVSKMVVFYSKAQAGPWPWWTVCSVYLINADGSLTLQGMVWSAFEDITFSSAFVVGTNKIDLAKSKTFDDEILVWVNMGSNINAPSLLNFPSINQITGRCSAINNTRWMFSSPQSAPGDKLFGWGVIGMDTGLGINAGTEDQAIFFMPNASGGTDICRYINNITMQASTIPLVVTLKATYPTGVMTKTACPSGGWAFTLATPVNTVSQTIADPAAVPNCFVDTGGTHYSQFPDAFQNYSGVGTDTRNDYYTVPRILRKSGNNFILIWFAPWFEDPTYVPGTNWTVKEKYRIQEFNPATGLYTDLLFQKGATAAINSIGGESSFGSEDYIDICGWTAYEHNGVVYIWHLVGASASSSARYYDWQSNVAEIDMSGQVFAIGCAQVTITGGTPQAMLGTVTEGDLSAYLVPGDTTTVEPIPASDWSYALPTSTMTGLSYLEGKTVYGIADGKVVGPLTVSGGAVALGLTASQIIVGLKYQSQFKTLKLDTGQPTIQGRRKVIPAVTLRLKFSVGMTVGTDDLADQLYQPKSEYGGYTAYTQGGAAAVAFSGDVRVNVQAGWETGGVICVEQDFPLPCSILGIIPEVTVGDNMR